MPYQTAAGGMTLDLFWERADPFQWAGWPRLLHCSSKINSTLELPPNASPTEIIDHAIAQSKDQKDFFNKVIIVENLLSNLMETIGPTVE